MRVFHFLPDDILSSHKSAYQHFNNLNEDVNDSSSTKQKPSFLIKKGNSSSNTSKLSKMKLSLPSSKTSSRMANAHESLYEITEVPEELNSSYPNSDESISDNALHNRLSSSSSSSDVLHRRESSSGPSYNVIDSEYPLRASSDQYDNDKPNCAQWNRNECQKSNLTRTQKLTSRKRRLFSPGQDCYQKMDAVDEAEEEHTKKLMVTLTAKDTFMDTLMKWTVFALICIALSPVCRGDERAGLATNNWERPTGMPKIAHLEVMCGNQHMEVHLAFDKPFHGLVTSKGMYGQQDCVYVPPRSGKNTYVFNIYYDKCGTKPDNHGKFYENTVVVQYDEELIEAWDEAKRLRCEWFNDYEKTATKTSPMVISDLEVVELNFHGDNVDCWMEVQEGKGPWAPPLNGIAPLGSTLTMVIAVKDPSGEFDMRVKDCEASDGQTGRHLALSDPEGCIVRPKLLGKFSKLKLDDGRATVMTYAFISAFKFPDMLNVHLRCTVEICRHGCPDHCSSVGAPPKTNVLGAYSNQEPLAAQSQQTLTKVPSPNKIPLNPESKDNSNGGKNGIDNDNSSDESGSAEKTNINKEALNHPNHNSGNGISTGSPPQFQQAPPPPPPLQNPASPQPVHLKPPVIPVDNFAPPQMRPPPPPPLPPFGGPHQPRPQRNPHGRPGPPHPSHSKFPPGLMRQRPDILKYPHPPQGPLPPRFTGTIKHTIGPDVGPPGQTFMEEQQRHHDNMAQNMMLKPEPKSDEELRQRSGEVSKEDDEPEKETVQEKKADEDESKEKETEMLMEAQPLKDTTGQLREEKDKITSKEEPLIPTAFPKGPRSLSRKRRSVSGSSDVIGVQGAFRVVSQADLNFALNTSVPSSVPTVVLRGKMSHGEPIYGICLPRVGFSVVFFGLGLATLVAILIAAFLAYAHYSVQHYKGQVTQHLSTCSAQLSANGTMSGHPSMPMPLPHQVLPMVILKKIW